MVQTRRQWNRWRDNNFQDSEPEEEPEEEEECEECSQSQQSDHYEYEGGNEGESNDHAAPYRERDNCHRHRVADSSPYTESVTTYRRRKPRR